MLKFLNTYLLVFLFSASIVLIGAYQYLGGVTGPSKLASDSTSPKIDFQNLDNFPSEFDARYTSNFFLNTPLSNLKKHYKYTIVQESTAPEYVTVGNEDWLYIANHYNDFYRGKRTFNQKEIDTFTQVWNRRINYLDSLNIPVYFVIGPMKNQVYPEHMPFNIYRETQDTRLQKLMKSMDSTHPNLMMYPLNEFLEQKKKKKLYYKLDNHWNFSAGEIASKLLVDRIKKEHPEFKIPEFPKFAWNDSTIIGGNLKKTIDINHLSETDIFPDTSQFKAQIVFNLAFTPPENFENNFVYQYRYENHTIPNSPKILFFRDSYAFQMTPFINECFSESLYIFDKWEYKLDKKIVKKYKPDIVVFVCTEANLHAIYQHGFRHENCL